MKRSGFIVLILIVIGLQLKAQNEADALRFSMISPGGTARFVGTGGAFGALGGDFSTLSTNPAGIALFRSSEFTITPNINYTLVQSSFFGNAEEDIRYNFNLSNLGFVFAFNNPQAATQPAGWKGFQFGMGFNRLADFSSRRIYEGFNTERSLMGVFLDKAWAETNWNSSLEPQEFLSDYNTGLAWDTWLLDLDEYGYFVDLESHVNQRRITNTKGGINELNFTFGANYNHRFYLGASLGLPFLNYSEDYIFYEEDTQNLSPEFRSLQFNENVSTTGMGANFKIGAIYRVSDMVRLGAALHTPTFYRLDDDWRTSMKSDLATLGQREARSPRSQFQYELTTPLRLTGSLGLVFGAAGLLSVDYEYVDYTQMRLSSSEDEFLYENRIIRDEFQAQHNIRLGGEIRINPIILRAGYAIHSNPYQDNITALEKSTISGGIGIRERSFFVDFAYFLTQYSQEFFPYLPFDGSFSPVVNYDFARQGFLMTVGFRF
jgi:hypothetical protein